MYDEDEIKGSQTSSMSHGSALIFDLAAKAFGFTGASSSPVRISQVGGEAKVL